MSHRPSTRRERERAGIRVAVLDRVFELARHNRKPDSGCSFNHWWLYRPTTDARAVRIAGET